MTLRLKCSTKDVSLEAGNKESSVPTGSEHRRVTARHPSHGYDSKGHFSQSSLAGPSRYATRVLHIPPARTSFCGLVAICSLG